MISYPTFEPCSLANYIAQHISEPCPYLRLCLHNTVMRNYAFVPTKQRNYEMCLKLKFTHRTCIFRMWLLSRLSTRVVISCSTRWRWALIILDYFVLKIYLIKHKFCVFLKNFCNRFWLFTQTNMKVYWIHFSRPV